MAGHPGVQEYLHRHKIGPLFEELMAKVISDQPDEPIPFLLRVLQRKADRMGTRTGVMRKSKSATQRPSSPERRPVSQSATWASGDGPAKTYEKPWQTNSKKVRPQRSEEGRRKDKSGWDHTTKAGNTFDEMWEQKHEQRSRSREASPTRQTRLTWADGNTQDEELLYISSGYSGPKRSAASDLDPLAGELKLSSSAAPSVSSQQSADVPLTKKSSSKDSHKKALQQLVLKETTSSADSGYEEEIGQERDTAIELMESAEDLKNEGVKKVRSSGVKMSSRSQQPASESNVKISICATCARVMSGEPSDRAPGMGYGELPDYSYGTPRAYGDRPSTANSARSVPLGSDDEEFESVSQVTGPRRPVWHEDDTPADALTPRKGSHMFSSHGVPQKGSPIYSPGQSAVNRRDMDVSQSQPSSMWGSPHKPSSSEQPSRQDSLDQVSSGTKSRRDLSQQKSPPHASWSAGQPSSREKDAPLSSTWAPGKKTSPDGARLTQSQASSTWTTNRARRDLDDTPREYRGRGWQNDQDDEGREVMTPSALKSASKGWVAGYDTDASSVNWSRDKDRVY